MQVCKVFVYAVMDSSETCETPLWSTLCIFLSDHCRYRMSRVKLGCSHIRVHCRYSTRIRQHAAEVVKAASHYVPFALPLDHENDK